MLVHICVVYARCAHTAHKQSHRHRRPHTQTFFRRLELSERGKGGKRERGREGENERRRVREGDEEKKYLQSE